VEGAEHTVVTIFICSMANKCTIISQISHSYMFRHYRVIFREFVISA